MSLSLWKALRSDMARITAFIGSGGKTTAIFKLARESNRPVIVTATSHLGAWQSALADRHLVANNLKDLPGLNLNHPQVTLITGALDGDRIMPVSRQVLERIREHCADHSIPLLIEADGSRQKPLKAWATHEPPIPDFADTVVHVVGMKGIGRPLSADNVHRAEMFSEQSSLNIGDVITPDRLIKVLLHTGNLWDRRPASARRIVLLNQADSLEHQSMAQGMTAKLLSKFHAVVVSNLAQDTVLAVHEPVAGIVLAAGESARFGSPKQLLDWHGEPFVRVVARKAIEAGLWPVIVVTGAFAEEVGQMLGGLNVQTVRNERWKTGQSSSIVEGLRFLQKSEYRNTGGCIFLLADQPHITTSVLQALEEKHAQGLSPVVVPLVMDRRANPVLFDRVTFSELLTLAGDVGGRAVFHKFDVEYLPWHDDRLLLDVDTPEHYRRLLEDETL